MGKSVVVKLGQIIENYRGEFAQVIAIRNNFAYLSPWFKQEKMAKEATRGLNRQNVGGLATAMDVETVELKDEAVKEDEEPTLSDSTVAQLKEIIVEMGVEKDEFKGLKKPELIELIEAQDSADSDDGDDNEDDTVNE